MSLMDKYRNWRLNRISKKSDGIIAQLEYLEVKQGEPNKKVTKLLEKLNDLYLTEYKLEKKLQNAN